MLIRSDDGSTHHNLGKDHFYTKVNRESHLIKKPTSPPLTPTSKTHRQPQPVIIYAHAPRVIHTKPQEFKALVQTLTGFSGNKTISPTTKNDSLPSPPAQPLTPRLPPPSKVPMYYDFNEFETKNAIPVTNNNLFNIDDHNTLMMEDSANISFLADCGGDGGFFAPSNFNPHIVQQASSTVLPFFAPTYGDSICGSYNNFNTTNSVGIMNKQLNNNQNFSCKNYVSENGNGSGCYSSDGVSSSLDLSSSDPSSIEEAMVNELADFY